MKYKVNTILYTKNGRGIGNAIVTGHEGDYNVIKTDYGNTTKLTDNELGSMFWTDTETVMPEMLDEFRKSHKNYTKT